MEFEISFKAKELLLGGMYGWDAIDINLFIMYFSCLLIIYCTFGF